MRRFILAAALALLGGSAMAQSYYYDPATRSYYQYTPVVQAGNVVVSPAGVTTASYYTPATTYYAPAQTYYYPSSSYYYPRSSYYYPTSTYYGSYNYNGWVDYGRGYRNGWRR